MGEAAVFDQHVDVPEDRCHGGTNLVAHVGEKRALRPRGRFGLALDSSKLGARFSELLFELLDLGEFVPLLVVFSQSELTPLRPTLAFGLLSNVLERTGRLEPTSGGIDAFQSQAPPARADTNSGVF